MEQAYDSRAMHESEAADLRYIAAAQVRTPAGGGRTLDIRDAEGETLGSLDGLVIDPVERRLRFFVVRPAAPRKPRRYLLSTEHPAQLEADGNALRLDVSRCDLAVCQEFRSVAVPAYSDDDLLADLFRRTG